MSYIVNSATGEKKLLDESMASKLVARGDWEYEEGSKVQVLYRGDDDEFPKVYDLDPEKAASWVRNGGEILTKESAEKYGYEYTADHPGKYEDYGTTAALLGVIDNLSWYQGKNLLNKMDLPASEIIRDNPWEHGLADAGTGLTTLALLGLMTGASWGKATPLTGPAMAAQGAKLGVRGQKLLGLLKKGLQYTPAPVGQKVFTSLARSPAASGLGIAGAAAGGLVSGGAGVAPGFLLGTAAGKKFFQETMHQLPAKVLGPTGAPGRAIIDKFGPLYGTGNLINNIFRGHSGRIAGLGGEAMVYGLGYGISEADWDKPLPEIAEYISEVAGMSAGIGLGLSGAFSGAIGGAKLTAKGVFYVPKKIHDSYMKKAAGTIDDIGERAEAEFTGKSAEALGETSLIKRLDADGVEARKNAKELISDLPELEREANEVIQDVLDVDSTIRSWDQVGFDGAWLMKEVERYVTSGNVEEQVNPALASLEAYRLIQVLKEKINEITAKIQHTMVIDAQTGKPIESSRVVGLDDILGEIDPKHEKVAKEIGPGDRGDNWVLDDWRKALEAIESEIKSDLKRITGMNREGIRKAAIDGLHVTPKAAKEHKKALKQYAKDRIAHLGQIYDKTYFDESGKLKRPYPEGKEYLELLDNRALPEHVKVVFSPISKKEGTIAMTHVDERDGIFNYKIQLDYKKILESWKRKDWENPTLDGVLPLHELANNTPEALRLRFNEPDAWFHFILEHELQHILTPRDSFSAAISGEKELFEKTFWTHFKRLENLADDYPDMGPDEALTQFESGVARAFRKAEQAIRKGRAKEKKPQVDYVEPLEPTKESRWLTPDDAPDLGDYSGGLVGLQRSQLEAARKAVDEGRKLRGEKPLDVPSELDITDSSVIDLMRIISNKSISDKERRRVLKIAMSELEDSEITGKKIKLTDTQADYENYLNRRALQVSPEIAPRYEHRVSSIPGFVDDAINQYQNDPLAALEIIEDYAPELFDNEIGRRLTVLLFKQFEELASDIHVRARNGEFTQQTIDTGILTRMKDLIRKHLSDDDYLRSMKDSDGFEIDPIRENRKPYGGLAKHKTILDNLFFERESSADAVKEAFGVISQSDHRTWEADPNMVKKWMESLRGTTYNKQIPVLLNYLRSTKELFDKLVHDGHYGGASGTPHAREVMRRRFGRTYTDKQWNGLLERQAQKINKMHKEALELNEKFTSPEMRHALAWIAATAREGSHSELSRLRASSGASPINMALGGAAIGGYLGGIPGALAGGVIGGAARPAVDLFTTRVGSEKLYLRQIGMIEAMFKAGEETLDSSIDSFTKGLKDKGPIEGRGVLKYPRALISRQIALQVEGSSHFTAGIVGPQEDWEKEKKKEKLASGNKFGAEEFDNARIIFSGLMENPEMLDRVIKFSVGELEGATPQLASFLYDHWKNAIVEMAKVINKASPPVDKSKVFAEKASLPDSVLHDVGEKLKIFDHNSVAVLKKMKDGTLTQSDVDFFKRINPLLWGAMTEKFMVILQDEEIRDNLNEQEKRMIKLLIGEGENTALHSALQNNYLPAGEGEGGGMMGQPQRKGSAKKMDLPTGQTMMDIVERGPTGAMAGTALA